MPNRPPLSEASVSRVQISVNNRNFRENAGLLAAGLTTIGYAGALAALSKCRNDGILDIKSARGLLVTASVVAGAAYLAGLWLARARSARSGDLIIILTVGLIARIILIPADPLFVTDFYRYLWDGAVTATGMNPWVRTPQSIQSALDGNSPNVPPELVDLARASGRTIHDINHPHLTTIYPATAQAAFAIAYWIKPWSVGALRTVLLLFDLATVLLLVALLRSMGRPFLGIAWYWWNPLLLREVSHSAHMDVIILPLVLGGLLFAARRSTISAALALALAVGAKVWPIVLLLLLIRMATHRVRDVMLFLGVFTAASAFLWAPLMQAAPGSNGFLTYASAWYSNDAAFRAIAWLTQQALALIKLDPGFGPRAARVFVAGLLAGCVILQTRRVVPQVTDLVRRSLLVIAAVFILSPTQFPWYFVWMLPLLAAAPRFSLLAYTAVLPLYYLYDDHPWVVWIEHLPVMGWFAAEVWLSKRSRPTSLTHAGVT